MLQCLHHTLHQLHRKTRFRHLSKGTCSSLRRTSDAEPTSGLKRSKAAPPTTRSQSCPSRIGPPKSTEAKIRIGISHITPLIMKPGRDIPKRMLMLMCFLGSLIEAFPRGVSSSAFRRAAELRHRPRPQGSMYPYGVPLRGAFKGSMSL